MVKGMVTTFGLVLIEGVTIEDLAAVGWRPTGARAPGTDVLRTDDPAACELGGGVLLAQGHTDIAQENETYALALGTRLTAIGVATGDKTYFVSVHDPDGVVRHVVETLEERTFERGEPLPEEEGVTRLDQAATLGIFEGLTGISLDNVMASEFSLLRPLQEHDEVPGRPLVQRLLGLHSNAQGYADKTGPPVFQPSPEKR